MTHQKYQSVALEWLPDSRNESTFHIIAGVVFIVVFVVATLIGRIEVPEVDRKKSIKVPDRIAEFISEKEALVPAPTPAPTPVPKPLPTPKPKVAREMETEEEKEPLTVVEQEAREKAQKSGLLALGSELADLIDTSDIDELLGGVVEDSKAGKNVAVGHNTDALTAGVGEGSGGVDSSQYIGGGVGHTTLSKREVALVKQSLFKSDVVIKTDGEAKVGGRSGKIRSEEDVTIVFDQNKGTLYSIYNRERRKQPGLKGKIVLELTISPEGKVTHIRIVSSELNSSSLERRLLSRIRMFMFGVKDVKPVTVIFPIEFLPS